MEALHGQILLLILQQVPTVNYLWTVPNTPSTTCKVRVTANGSVSDASNANFTITSGSGLPDLSIHVNSYTPTTVTPGTLITVNYTKYNYGSVNALTNTIGIYISNTNIFNSGTDQLLGTWTNGGPNANSNYTDNLNFYIPYCYACGNYYIFLDANYDGAITESNYNNNTDYFQLQITGCTTCSYSIPSNGTKFSIRRWFGNC